ncbi:MAG: hypothetical protein DMF64_08050 [Acidobacteria bacterium]|nr:MAG: hypothetical protein DMF64_08050 [Acidobacteriota bacterium]
MDTGKVKAHGQAGFSLLELLIAMAAMVTIAAAASTLLLSSFNVRSREDQRSDALADAQRAVNIMTRELANAGYKLPRGLTYTNASGTSGLVPRNGLLPSDCDSQSIAYAANLDAMDGGSGSGNVYGQDEAIKFQFYTDATGDSFLVRRELRPGGNTEVLANRIDGMNVQYLDAAGNDTLADVTKAVGVRIRVWVNLRATGSPGSPGYQPARQVVLNSGVELHNANLNNTY